MDKTAEYYIRWRGRIEGPYSLARVRTLMEDGRLTRHHQFSRDRKTWRPLSSLGDKTAASDEHTSEQSTGTVASAQRGTHTEDPDTPHLRLRNQKPGATQSMNVTHADEWFYIENDQPLGPVSKDALVRMFRDGVLAAHTQICRDGDDEWQSIGASSEFAMSSDASGDAKRPAVSPNLATSVFAGFWKRAVASLFDTMILAAALTAVLLVLGAILRIAGLAGSEIGLVLKVFAPILVLVSAWAYYTCMESSPWGATVGKSAMGIHVTGTSGQNLSFGRANARYWAKTISAVILFIGFIMAAFTEKKQALHDMLARTIVLARN